jgi:GT2 family glycosyltransferase
MRISLVIPYYHSDDEKPGVLCGAVGSMIKFVDELIVVSEKLDNLATKINRGLRQATGDYIIVTNDDVVLTSNNLDKLCLLDKVTTPNIHNGSGKLFHGHAWCMPRHIYSIVGGIYEGYDGFYYDDSDYWMSIEKAGFEIVKVSEVVMDHNHPARTIGKLTRASREDVNKNIFISRWGEGALAKIQ